MLKAIRPFLLAVGAAALLAAIPSPALAYCQIQTGDLDHNGMPTIRFMGGNDTNEGITINVGPTSTAVTGCGSKTFNTNFAKYYFHLNGGQDTINFNVVGTWVGIHKAIEVQDGIGVAKVTIGGTGSMTAKSSLIVEVAALQGADNVAFAPPTMNDSLIEGRVILGPGNDSLIVKLANPITNGSIVKVDADLGGDTNSFKFTQTALVDATVDIGVLGGLGADNGTYTLAGPVGAHGRLTFRADLGGGDDDLDGQVSMPLFSVAAGGEVHLDVMGGAGNDTLTLSRKGTTGDSGTIDAGLLDVRLDGGTGDDLLAVDVGGGGFVTNGTIRIREDGGAGNDMLSGVVDVQAASVTPTLDILLYGGAGQDQVTATVNNHGPNGAARYGPAGAVLLDGGLDPGDNCSSSGNGLVHERNCES